MTQEDKELLLKDLCARLPYGVKIQYNGWDYDRDCEFSTVETLIGIDDMFIYTLWSDEKDKHSIVEPLSITDYKPYLRPMSSMTEEEKEEMHNLLSPEGTAIYKNEGIATSINHHGEYVTYEFMNRIIQYLLENHFDFMGLLDKGLAIEVKEENNPYKD